MKKSGVARENIFLETKIWPAFYEQEDAVEKTLERLDTEYIDLLLIHQPAGNHIAGNEEGIETEIFWLGRTAADGFG